MFDNGNFRRKRKRRSDPSSGATAKVEDCRGAAGPSLKPSESTQLLGPSSPDLDPLNESHRSSSPVGPAPGPPCFNNFYNNMSALGSGGHVRQGPLGLVNELSNRNISALSPYPHHGHTGGQDPGGPEPTDGLHFNRGVYYNSSSSFYNSFSLNIYPRDGTEV